MLKFSWELCSLKLGKRMKEQEQTLLYQGVLFETDSVQYLFDQDKKPNILTIVKFSDSITAKIVGAGNKKYLTTTLDRKKN